MPYLVELLVVDAPKLIREFVLLTEGFRIDSFVVSMEELPE
jgi:hypothetical protein